MTRYYYAVKKGRKPGIYSNWDDAKPQVDGFPQSRFKKFKTETEAANFMAERDGCTAEPTLKSPQPNKKRRFDQREQDERDASIQEHKKTSKNGPLRPEGWPDKDTIVVFTDGSCLNNGKSLSIRRAGLGVFFEPDTKRRNAEKDDQRPVVSTNFNVAERVAGRGEMQTNNRGELTGIVRAIEQCTRWELVQAGPWKKHHLHILTDSQYSRDCIQTWVHVWRKRNWMTSTGKRVSNIDLLEKAIQLIAFRKSLGALVKIDHVKGHSVNQGNIQADRLANEGAKLPPRIGDKESTFDQFRLEIEPLMAQKQTSPQTIEQYLETLGPISVEDLLTEEQLEIMEATQAFE